MVTGECTLRYRYNLHRTGREEGMKGRKVERKEDGKTEEGKEGGREKRKEN